jgi:hypothetical protein
MALLLVKGIQISQGAEKVDHIVELNVDCELKGLRRQAFKILGVMQYIRLGSSRVNWYFHYPGRIQHHRQSILVIFVISLGKLRLWLKRFEQVFIKRLIGIFRKFEYNTPGTKMQHSFCLSIGFGTQIEEAYSSKEVLDILFSLFKVKKVELLRGARHSGQHFIFDVYYNIF